MDGIIDCETHYFSEGFLEMLRSRTTPPRQEVHGDLRRYFCEPSSPEVSVVYPSIVEEKLLDLGDSRVALMDAHGIAAQVVSLTSPGTDVFEREVSLKAAAAANDVLGAAVARYPGRFIGFATLYPFGGDESASELERCVTELGFRGANIHSHVGDRYLDDRRCWPIFEAAQRLGVPINIHPTLPLGSMVAPYLGYGWTLSGPGLGFGHEAAVQVCRLIFAGVFDAYPDLQFMLGHCGEALPFWMYRLDFPYIKPWIDLTGEHPKLERKPSEYLTQNFWYNISGNFFNPAVLACLHAVGSDRLMFGSDHPYETYEEACGYINTMPVSEPDRLKIASLNARRLFKLDGPSASC
ncbi:amidohydrolase family protein [Streptomyces sp. NBC_00063]|uniref:amidohydrolase family protein n=1 Tax=Streptomyces sp. NBC_00063 TaxID=2975638 RepID=UPI003D71EF19